MPPVQQLEATRLAEQIRLDAIKTPKERNKLGQFATPPALAKEIARFALQYLKGKRGPVSFLDPAIGTGSFYAATLDTFGAKRILRAAGIEIDQAFATAARELWEPTGLEVIPGDFTRQPEPESPFNLIITNPPYVRHHHLGADDKPRLRAIVVERLGIQISGLAGLYCYFLLLADSWLEVDGLAIWLIPSEFMDVNYGVAVKQYLTDHVSLLRIHRFCPSDVQFDDALVSSAVVVFKKTPPSDDHSVEFSFGGSLQSPTKSQHLALASLRGQPKWTAFPSDSKPEFERSKGLTLSDLFTVKRGLATGDNSFFILPRSEAKRLGIPKDCLRPILPSPRFLSERIIECDQDGYPRIERSLALIDCNHSERELHERHPDFWNYLEQGRARAVDKGYLCSRRTPWYSQERREPAPFVCTYMGRSRNAGNPFRFIWNKSQAIAANVYLMLYPKPELQQALASRPELYEPIFEALSEIEASAFTSEGRVYGGGLYKMEPAEMGRLPATRLAEIAGLNVRKRRQLVAFA